ncbi:MAG TPA: hypothetical protein VN114_01490 [Oxalicibacterium sp.]|uniref:hypothetical protein n=1 Tax=Oxalicibacterium sp. TaxID=2766525 RepID=UPI002CFC900B|nr:hypothetical protein [Oxalicibacterium sp.]HWU97156.1 hypothetical protein [Oxalicibacterium sp.]
MQRILLTGILAAAASGAMASSPEAWQTLYDTTAKACLQKSTLKDPRIVDGPVVFSGAIVYRIKGLLPQMSGQINSEYCLHPYPKGEPEIAEGMRKR